MADRRDYYFRQKVTEGELDDGFEGLENADRAIMADQLLTGVFKSDGVEEHSPQNLTVDVLENVAYDDQGQRIAVPATQNVDLSTDWLGAPTAVGTSGHEKWITIFVEFQRSLSDPRVDGNSDTVFFERNESFAFKVVQGSESIPNAVRPALEPGRVLIADVRLTFGLTAIPNANIDLSRRQSPYSMTGNPNVNFTAINATEFVEQIRQLMEDHIDGSGYNHDGTSLGFSATANWKDGSGVSSINLNAAVNEIVSDLAADDGANRVGSNGTSIDALWDIPAGGSVYDALENLVQNISTLDTFLKSVAGGNDGASYIGTESTGGFSGSTVRAQLDEIDGPNGSGIVGALATGGLPSGSVASQLAALDQADVGTKVFWVNSSASSGGTGRQHDPFDEINDALVAAASINGALIMVAPGSYSGLDNSSAHSSFDWRIVAYGPTRSTVVSGDTQAIYRGNSNPRRFLFDGLTIIPSTSGKVLTIGGTSGSTYTEFANCYLYDMAISRAYTGVGDKLRIYAHGKEAMDLIQTGPSASDYLFGGTSGTPYEISVTLRNVAVQIGASMQVYQLFAENMVMYAGASQDIRIWHEAAGVNGALNVMRSRLGSGSIARIGSTDSFQGYWDTITNYWRYVDGLTVTDVQPVIMHNETV